MTTPETRRPIVNLDELPAFAHYAVGDRFESRDVAIGRLLGAHKLGYTLTVVPPGKCSCPFHNHRVNEEMFFIVAGRGQVRIGDRTHAVRAGDIIAAPAGGPQTAHQLVNDSDADLKYLAISTKERPDIVEYPDSGKFSADTGPAEDATAFRFVGYTSAQVDYWAGETPDNATPSDE